MKQRMEEDYWKFKR